MKHLIVQDWQSTHNNHAGMVHMCNLLKKKYSQDYNIIIQPIPFRLRRDHLFVKRIYNRLNSNKHLKKFSQYWMLLIQNIERLVIYIKVLISVRRNDEIFLLEYLHYDSNQLEIAKYIRKFYPTNKIYALAHLTPTAYELLKKEKSLNIEEWCHYVDKVLTLGHSLTNYFIDNNISPEKISTGLHYVDSEFYHPDEAAFKDLNNVTAIVMGCLQREKMLISEIVNQCTNINWILCTGGQNLSNLYKKTSNLEIKGYISEEELLECMKRADISVNVMADTVGSNVITTSMSIGLALVVSDVGSIKDYCNEKNAIFCSNDKDCFINALCLLSKDKELLSTMKRNSVAQSEKFNIEHINTWLSNLSSQ